MACFIIKAFSACLEIPASKIIKVITLKGDDFNDEVLKLKSRRIIYFQVRRKRTLLHGPSSSK
ncbi:hypothetical protein JCM17380_32850 [Desulfosporosinus burensis]